MMSMMWNKVEEWLVIDGITTVLPIVVLTLTLAFVVTTYVKRKQKFSLLSKFPGPSPLPIIGNAWLLNCDSVANFRLLNKIWGMGEIVTMWQGSQPRIMLTGANACQALLGSTKELNKGMNYKYVKSWLGNGLLVTNGGTHWHSRRKLLTKAFHFRILNNFLPIFNHQANTLVDKLHPHTLDDNKEPFNIIPYLARCSLDIIFETAMGRSIHAQESESSVYVQAMNKLVNILDERIRKIWQSSDTLFRLFGRKREFDECVKLLQDLSLETIAERRSVYLEEERRRKEEKEEEEERSEEDLFVGKGKKQLALLDLLLDASEEGKTLTDEDIMEEINTFMFAGHDTTATGMSWFLYLMGRNTHAQAKVHEELDSIFGNTDRPATMEDLATMKYLENCIKETLRLFPPVPRIGRKLTEDMMIGNECIPAGVSVSVAIFKLHRQPDQFPDPEKFDPDRFLPEVAAKRHPFAYVPFSAGSRNCIGQKFAMVEEKVVLSSVLRKYRVLSDVAERDLKLTAEAVLRPLEGNYVRLLPRHS